MAAFSGKVVVRILPVRYTARNGRLPTSKEPFQREGTAFGGPAAGYKANKALSARRTLNMKPDIHSYEERYQKTLARFERKTLLEVNKKHIRDFCHDCELRRISKPRIERLLEILAYMAQTLQKDFREATIGDLKNAVLKVDNNPDWAPWTKYSYKRVLKQFYKWLKGVDNEYPPEVKWLKPSMKRQEKYMLNENDLVTEEEVRKLIEATDQSRNKAIISLLAESGARIGEVGNLRIRDISFDKLGTIMTVNGKTGPRRIRVVHSTPYILTWVNNHPARHEPDAALWISMGSLNFRKPLRYEGFTKILREAFKKASIKKRCNPHIFRHSRASQLAKHMTEFQMNQYFGWIQGSDMPSTYVHLSGKDIDDAILKLSGVKTEEQPERVTKPSICPRCEYINPQGCVYCGRCAEILDKKVQIEQQKRLLEEHKAMSVSGELMNRLVQDPEVAQMLVKKIAELGLGEKLQEI